MRVRQLSQYLFGALTIAALAGSASRAEAQSTASSQGATSGSAVAPRKVAPKAKLHSLTPAQRKVAKAKMRHRAHKRVRNTTPAQRKWARSASIEQKTLRSQVKAGTITKESAVAQRKSWRLANPRPNKTVAGK